MLPSGRERAAARPEFGGYTAAKAAPYIGRYVLVRGTEKVSKVTKRAGHFEAHGMEIVWDQAAPALRLRDLFFEDEKNGVFGEGLVRMPEGSRYLFVDMVYLGWPSLYILSRMPAAGAAILHGVIVATDLGSAPVVMPAFLKRRDGLDLKKEQVTPRETGLFSGSDIEFQHGRFHREYRTELERIDVAGFLRVLRLPSLGDHLTPPPKGIVSTNR